MSQPFIPRDKPKSWVLFVCAGLSALLVFAPIIGLGILVEAHWVRLLGIVGFVMCWYVMAVAGVIAAVGSFSGRYRDLSTKDWKDQIW